MNKSNYQIANGGADKNSESKKQTGSSNSGSAANTAPAKDGKHPIPQVANKPTGKGVADKPVGAKDAIVPAPAGAKSGAAKGDDDAMSEPQPSKSKQPTSTDKSPLNANRKS